MAIIWVKEVKTRAARCLLANKDNTSKARGHKEKWHIFSDRHLLSKGVSENVLVFVVTCEVS